MLTKNQQQQVVNHLDKACLILQAASEDFEYRLVQHLIIRLMYTVEKYEVRDEK